MTADREYMGQHYEAVGERQHTCRDGSEIKLTVWASLCAQCGELFFCTTAEHAVKFNPNRRCEKHRRPGQRVRSRNNG